VLLAIPSVLVAGMIGCEGADPSGAAAPGSSRAPPRIISLAPAITSTAVLLGAESSIVGRTPWCRTVPASIAVAGDGTSIDAERMLALRPTLILYQQTVSGGPHDDLARLASGRDWTVRSWRLDRLDDVRAMIEGLAETLGDAAVERSKDLLERFDRACAPSAAAQRMGPTVLLFAVDPPTAFGPGSYIDDVWRAIGGTNAIKAGAYPELSVEELVRIDPAWIVLIGSDVQASALARMPVRAIVEGRVVQAPDPGLLEPGGRAIIAIESLRERLDAAVKRALESPHRATEHAP